MTEQIYKFHIKGMHCKACALKIEDELKKISEISQIEIDFKNQSAEIKSKNNNKEKTLIVINELIGKFGYELTIEKHKHKVKWSEFKIAFPIAIIFISFFLLLQKIGIVNLVSANNVNYTTAFLVGIIASLSTCIAVVGGLILSVSASFAKEGNKIKPQIMLHIGRIVSFFVLGGVIGVIGSAFQLNNVGTFILSLFIGIVMLILGINLLDIFPWAKKIQFSLPKTISGKVLGVAKINNTLAPLLIGAATFFFPCGFTQSMQIYTLSTGSFIRGATTMFAFALGTFPVLALISFSSFSIQKSSKAGIFFKAAGLIVILFALFNIINSLVIINIIPPLFNL